jgi:hypothetical protein
MRTSTLATFDVVRTVPETVSPECTVVSLTATDMICGGASEGRRGIAGGLRGAVTGTAVSTGGGVAVAPTVGVAAGAWPVGVAGGCEAGVEPGDAGVAGAEVAVAGATGGGAVAAAGPLLVDEV